MKNENAAQLSNSLGPADWIVFAGVLIFTLAVVVWGNLRRKRLDETGEDADFLDLLLMGRRLTLPLFTGTLVATWYGGILPVTEMAFEYGLYSWLTQGVFWYGAYILFAEVLVKRIRNTQALTMPDLLAKEFGPVAGKLGAVLNLVNVLPLIYLLSLAVFLQSLFGGGLMLWMLGGAGVVLAYSLFGGFRSVVFSDMVQFGVMCSAVMLVIVFSMGTYGGISWLRASPNIPDGHWNPLGEGVPLRLTLIWGLIAAGTLVDPNFYQRCLAAKDVKTARKGIWMATGIWIVFDFCTTFGAFYARAVMPDADSTSVYLYYGVQVLPWGLKGFFLAGVLATILSTLDSYLFLSGTLVSFDLMPKKWKGKVGVHHVGTLAVTLFAVFLTQYLHEFKLVDIWKLLAGFSTACLIVPLLLGMGLKPYVGELTFLTSCLSGVVLMTMFYSFGLHTYAEFADTGFYFGLAGSIAGMGAGMGAEWKMGKSNRIPFAG